MHTRLTRLLVPALLNTIALALAPAGAQAINPSQVSLIQPGMSRAQVEALIGQPFHQFHFVKEGVTTLTYEMPDAADRGEVFDVDVDATGHVVNATEAVEVIGHRARR
ncbi:outer membrane protein assembly factor BamE domain-containing protein [Roseateles sp.]|uniref:outer membrane protein assembly factor BamE domain-containing protein n=1 Tax=Roseateles sp. TaxID=1971397 RepID=UPI003BA854F2